MKLWPLITTISISKEEESIFFSVFFFFSFHLEDDKFRRERREKRKYEKEEWQEIRKFMVSEEQRINQKEIVCRFKKISKTLFRTEKIFEDPKKGLELWNTKCFGGSADANEKEKKG